MIEEIEDILMQWFNCDRKKANLPANAIADFLGEGFENTMRVVARRHDLIAVSLTDPREIRVPDVGLIDLEDAETGRRTVIDTGSATVRRQYESLGMSRAGRLRELFRSLGVDQIDVLTNEDYVRTLVRFFRSRERKAQRGH